MCQFCERAKQELDPGNEKNSLYEPLSATARMEAERCSALRSRRTPVTVICGFLGSGKTTLLNHILRAPHGLRLAVLENEVGEVPIDGDLISGTATGTVETAAGPEVVLMPNGCLCCRTRGDLRDALRRLVERAQQPEGQQQRLDGVIMELSGASEVAPVLQTFFVDTYVQSMLQVDSVVCVCDAPRLAAQLLSAPPPPPPHHHYATAPAAEAVAAAASAQAAARTITAEQLALSDTVLLNKADLATPAQLSALRSVLSGSSADGGAGAGVAAAVAVMECVRGAVDVRCLLGTGAFSLARAVAADDAFLTGGGGGDGGGGGGGGGEGHGGEHHHHHHVHAHNVLGLRTVGAENARCAVDAAAVVAWVRGVASTHGEHVWRIKGVLWAAPPPPPEGLGPRAVRAWAAGGSGMARRTVLQGVGGHVEVEEMEWPAGRPRRSRLVLIGPLSPELQAQLREGLDSVFGAPTTPAPAPTAWLPTSQATGSAASSTAPAPLLPAAATAAASPACAAPVVVVPPPVAAPAAVSGFVGVKAKRLDRFADDPF